MTSHPSRMAVETKIKIFGVVLPLMIPKDMVSLIDQKLHKLSFSTNHFNSL